VNLTDCYFCVFQKGGDTFIVVIEKGCDEPDGIPYSIQKVIAERIGVPVREEVENVLILDLGDHAKNKIVESLIGAGMTHDESLAELDWGIE
jgi:hypothetical protein